MGARCAGRCILPPVDEPFRVALTRDFLNAGGGVALPADTFAAVDRTPGVSWEYLSQDVPEITPDVAARYDAILTLRPRYSAASVARADRRLALVARFGVGYDSVDIDACTRNGIAVTITPDGVRRPMAQPRCSPSCWPSPRSHAKDRITREGGWDRARDYMGSA